MKSTTLTGGASFYIICKVGNDVNQNDAKNQQNSANGKGNQFHSCQVNQRCQRQKIDDCCNRQRRNQRFNNFIF